MPFVYILRCRDNSLYTGCAEDILRRLAIHKSGKGAKYTRGRLPVTLVYYEKYKDMKDGYKREYRIKKMSRKQKEALIEKSKRKKLDEKH
jgi:putative endonuclease